MFRWKIRAIGEFFRPAGVVFILSFVIYLVLLCPSVAWDDSGEFLSACSCLGVPHAPGSPFLVILGKQFTFMPLGSVAFRLNLLSAMATSLSAALLCILLGRMRSPARNADSIAILLSLAWAVSPWVMRYALAIEVYGLAWIFLLAGFLLTEETLRRNLWGSCSIYILWGLLAGLGISTSVLLAPFAVLLCLAPFVDQRGWWKSTSRLLLGLSLGLLPLTLPLLRSASPPPVYYSEASTFKGFLHYLLGKQFESHMFESTPGAEIRSWMWAGAGVLILVFLLSRCRYKRRKLWIVGVGVLNLSFLTLHRHPGHFFVPWLCCVALLAAPSWPKRAGHTLATCCLLVAGLWSYYAPLRTEDIPLRWIQRSVRAIPPASTAFLGEINATFPLLYSTVIQREPHNLVIAPIWNSTRAQRLQQIAQATGTDFVDMDLVDYWTRTKSGHDPFATAVPDPVLLRLHPPDSLNWETWWDSERDWLRKNTPCMSRLDRRVLGKHYFNLGVFGLERGVPIADNLLGLARGLNPELPEIDR